jgi:selenocysteine insertion sequence-binding protein 2
MPLSVQTVEDAAPPMNGSRLRTSFLPSLLQMGIGLHPRASLLDHRTTNAATGVTLTSSSSTASDHRGLIREYCRNTLTDELDRLAFGFLHKLQSAQKKLKQQQPLHFMARRRYVSGLREVLKGVQSSKVRVLLVAPDVEPVEGVVTDTATMMATHRPTVKAMGLEGTVRSILSVCEAKGVPWVCCLSRKRLGHSLRMGSSTVSVVAVLSAEGAYEEYRQLVVLAHAQREEYVRLMTTEALQVLPVDIADPPPPSSSVVL